MLKKYYYSYTIFFIICFIVWFIWWEKSLTHFIWFTLFYMMLFYTFSYIWRSLKGVATFHIIDYIHYFIYKITILISIITLILAGLFFYSNTINPATMNQYTLSNGKKEVIFQEMIHIGRQNFYDNVVQDIYKYKQNNWVLFFEWVRPWSETSQKQFNKALGVEFDKDLYKNFSKLYGLVFQNNQDFLWKYNNLDFNIDTDLDTVMEQYNKKILSQKISHKNSKETHIEVPLDLSAQIINTLSSLTPRQLQILIYMNQGILNFLVQSDSTKKLLQDNFANETLFEIILHERNKIVIQEIIDSEYDKIFVIYGQLHFQWIFEWLKQNDNNWKIISTKKYYPITSKKDFF